MIGYELHAFISRGGKVLVPGDEDAGSVSAGVLVPLRVLIRRLGDQPQADPALGELDAELARDDDESSTDSKDST